MNITLIGTGYATWLTELKTRIHTAQFAALRAVNKELITRYPHLQGTQPVYRDFRSGDVRHSLADIGKAQRLLGYAPTQRIAQGLALAMPWYIGQQQSLTNEYS